MEDILYDAIVVGTGISGGWAAKELCEKGLKTLVLERGRMVKHIEDYPTMNKDNWDFKLGGQLSSKEKKKFHTENRKWAPGEDNAHFFVNAVDHPYEETKSFAWMRGYHVGGRSITWGRQSYRFSEIDFEANRKDGHGIDWPIRYKDISPWYDKVEKYIGVNGEKLGLKQLPDGEFLPPMQLNCVEQDLQKSMKTKFDDGRLLTIGRSANLTGVVEDQEGRTLCQYRNRCSRGCPFGGYFSSNSSTLPAAERTGNMTLRPNSIVHEIIYDEASKKATGVRVIDTETHEKLEFKTKFIFLCASAMASVGILLKSKSERFPNGLGNDSGALGNGIMDHHFQAGASADVPGYLNKYYKGRRPNGYYIPRFVNLDQKTKRKDYVRGFGYQGGASRSDWSSAIAETSYGKNLKDVILKPGTWRIGMTAFGEVLPYDENKVRLSKDKKDKWGLPLLDFDVAYKDNEMKMRKDMVNEAIAIFERAGFENVHGYDTQNGPGSAIHEMGGARMGHSPKNSIVNKNNQVHSVPNVYVTDGAFMTSSSCVNPSLTYMAFTARAANHAAEQFKTGEFS
ncbi:GMC family oxidoreductase [Maribacter algarum]|uniref:GMC family oxidoreductase n=1 Tax=Maribacter algarum (ex Zhang et al. 2020) TaxID=2578118 RepID=A0A5S3PUP8_9FLAO|nr:GMC family oxidoreductase [Maribacter algarum]TMM58729.1 GMC family oxidoreductase [Maribacter algarum]